MSIEANKDLVRSIYAMFDQMQNMAGADEIAAPGLVAHFTGMPPLDLAGFQEFGDAFYRAFPGLRHHLDQLVAEGDRVSVRLRAEGVHSGPLAGPAGEIPPTGRFASIKAITVIRLVDGKLAELWGELDMLGLMQQLGLVPAAQPATA